MARYWWTHMARHSNSLLAPFDVLVMDAWSPGKLPYPDSKHRPKSVLTGLCTLTGFAGAAFLSSDDSHEAAMKAFQTFFVPRGLPKLVIVDAGSQFAGLVQRMCGTLGIPFHAVTRENHRAILCERFHRFLNKVQRIHLRQCCSMDEWIKGTLFAVYAWNSAPVDGTNIVRSVAAIARDFPFPIDTEQDQIATPAHSNTGQQILDHVSATFPMLASQRTILRLLIEDRREHHRELKNRTRKEKQFAPGDMVVVRKQVTSGDTYGPAKLRLRARGPCRVLEEVDGGGSYRIQRMPFGNNDGHKGKPYKESAARMEKLPSSLVLHKLTDGIDTRFATYDHQIIPHTLENIIGIHEFGRFAPADPAEPFAYEKIEELWDDRNQGRRSSGRSRRTARHQNGHRRG